MDTGSGEWATALEYRAGRGRQGRIRGLLFDKDGTLFDFHATWSGWTRSLITELSDAVPTQEARLAAALAFDLKEGRFRKGSPVIAGTLDAIVETMLPALPGMRREALHAFLLRRAAEARPVEAAPLAPLLDSLKARGFALGVATNDAFQAARTQLARTGVLDRFDFVAGYDSGFGGKPGTGMARAFCRSLGLAPSEVAMIGDSAHDLHCAREAGMLALAVLTGPAEAADLASDADAILPDIGALLDWLDFGERGQPGRRQQTAED